MTPVFHYYMKATSSTKSQVVKHFQQRTEGNQMFLTFYTAKHQWKNECFSSLIFRIL